MNKDKIDFPKADKISHETQIHDLTLIDNYFWLRDKENPKVIDYLNDENSYTNFIMKDTEYLQEKIFHELKGRIKEDDRSVPIKDGNYFYYSRSETGKQYRIYCRKYKTLESEEEIILDENLLAEGNEYFQLGIFSVSPNHNLLAYSIDINGSEQFTLFIKELASGEFVNDPINNVSTDFEWADDNQTFYYTTLNEIQQADKVLRHKLGQNDLQDEVLYKEVNAQFFLSLSKSKDKKIIFINLGSKDEAEHWFINSNDLNGKFELFQKRIDKIEYYPEHHNNKFYIVTNYQDAKNFKIMFCMENQTSIDNWQDFIPYNPEIYIQNIECFKDFLVIHSRKNGYKHLSYFNFPLNSLNEYNFPDDVFNYSTHYYHDFESNIIRFSYSSMISPATVFELYLQNLNLVTLKIQEIPSGYDKNNYHCERIFVESHDGIKIPASILYKKGMEKNSENPLLLYAYGSYGFSIDPSFSSNIFSLIDRGLIYVLAHIRGGGEMGHEWYENGKMLNKINTFKDFISVGEYLVNEKYTSSEKLAIMGGSAGGLLIGAVLNMKTDLFKVAVGAVPFVDVINTMLDDTIPLTVAEYTEWGNPNEKLYFDYMLSYSPYNNIKQSNYPNILFTAGLNDPRVGYWEPAKFVAELRNKKTDSNILLLKTNMGAGHGGSSGRYDYLKEKAFEYSFIIKYLGLELN